MLWSGMMITTCTSCLTTGGSNQEHSAAPQKLTWGKFWRGQKEGGDATPQYPPDVPGFFGPESGQIWAEQDDRPETAKKLNPLTVKPETSSHMAEQSSWVPLLCCSPPGCPFPIKSLSLSVHMSSRTISEC